MSNFASIEAAYYTPRDLSMSEAWEERYFAYLEENDLTEDTYTMEEFMDDEREAAEEREAENRADWERERDLWD